MKTERIMPAAEMRVDAREIEHHARQALQQADVSRLSVRDPHGHTLIEVPVTPAEVPVVLEPVLAAVRAVGETVGEVTLRVEKTPGLPEATGTGSATRERGGAGMGGEQERRQGDRRQSGSDRRRAGGGQPEAEASGQQSSATVTRQDVRRMNEANRVPAGDEATMKRIAPEQEGEPDLKDTGEWPDTRQR